MSRSKDGAVRLILLVLFFLSGACGLIYEVVWMQMLTLVFGATAFATSTILASFFAGLALGSFYFGRFVDRRRNPLFVYALLEAGIAVFAFLMPLLFAGLTELYVGVSRQLGSGFYSISLLRLVLSFLVLLVPATLMGGTLPVIVKFFARRRERLAWNVGHLYAVNTAGAVVGAVSAGFLLILLLGVREAAYLAGVVNLLIAGTVFGLEWRLGPSRAVATDAEESEETPVASGADVVSPGLAHLALWAIGVSGFCALALEVFWTRALVFYLDNSTHAFTTILTAFLLGIAIGSFVIARFIDTRQKLVAWFGVTEILIGMSAMLAIPTLSNAASVFESMKGVPLDAWLPWKWMGMRFLKSLTVMLVPTVLIGMTFPLVSRIYTRNVGAVGTALGNLYSVNTVGGVFGSVVAGFILIPFVGVQNGIVLIAVTSVVIGGVLVLSEPSVTRRTRVGVVLASASVVLGAGAFYLENGTIILTSYYEGVEKPEVLSYEEGIGATVKVYADQFGDRVLSINGFPVAGTSFEAQDGQKALAHLPLLLSSAPSPRVNIIGFGAGGTSWGVLRYDVAEVDCVELVPGVIDAAKWFPDVNHGVLDQPGFNLILGDGRNYALTSNKAYDVISIDATSPKMAGNGSLYTLDFYELVKERLSDKGLAVQWLPIHLVSDREIRMVAKTFMTAFPHTTVWFTPLRQHLILIGTREPLEIDFAALSEKLRSEEVQRELEQFDVTDPVDLLAWFVMGEEALERYVGDSRINTDNHPYLEFTPAMAYFMADMYRIENMARISQFRENVFALLDNVGETEDEVAAVAGKVGRRFEAANHSIRGDIYRFLGMQDRAVAEYAKALRIDPREKNWLNSWRLARVQT